MSFYRDTSGTGEFNLSSVESLDDAVDNGDGSWSIDVDTTGLSGNQTFFAIVSDGEGQTSTPVAVTIGQTSVPTATITQVVSELGEYDGVRDANRIQRASIWNNAR